MKIRVDLQQIGNVAAIGVYLVISRKIAQRGLQHEGLWLLIQSLRASRCLDQHGLHLTPGRVIANADGGVQQQAPTIHAK